MTQAPTPQQAELASRVLSRRSLLPFVQRLNPLYLAGWVHKDICRRLEKFSDDVAKGLSPRLMLLMPPRAGKLMADDTPVPTTLGWKRHGELVPGDYVFGPDGVPTEVLHVSPPAPANMRVELSNGEVFYCHERHEWTLFERGAMKWTTRETQWLTSGIRGPRKLLSDNRCVYQLPTVAALEFQGVLPEGFPHPYMLGAWLGDGSVGKPCITHTGVKQAVIVKLGQLGYTASTVCTHSTTGVDTTYFGGMDGRGPGFAGRMTKELQAAGVYLDKGIPEIYQVLPGTQRRELLAGLIDTDGCTDENSRIMFSTAREELALSVMRLCEGLGLRPYLQRAEPVLSTSGIQGRSPIWTVGFQPTEELPLMVYHKRPKRFAPQRRVGFVDVRHDPQGKVGRCIQVARSDGLYVIGNKLVVTHNSELCSRAFPAWHVGRNPRHEIIACSYNVSLAMTFSKKVKEVLQDPVFHPVFDIRLDPNNQSAEEWALDRSIDRSHAGGYVAAGVGGGITGKGAHILIVDDPLKNAEEADSADTRAKLMDWYGSTAYTRLAPGGGVLIVQTCWHDSDLAGQLQSAMAADPDADQFVVVKYPAIAENNEYLDTDTDLIVYEPPDNGHLLRTKGEALHPERYDLQKLNQIKRTISPRFWSALYQQNPVPDDGAYFTKDTFRRAELPHTSKCAVYIAWDFAISEKKTNDYTVGTVLLHDENDVLHVADMMRFKSADAFFIVEAILNLGERWYSHNLSVGFEDGQIYRAIESLLKKRMRERRVYPAIQVLKPITDKLARARPLQGRMQQGMVSFNSAGEWFDACRTEMLRFPAGAHDDMVDSLSWAVQMAIGRQPPRSAAVKPLKSWRDRINNTGSGSYMSA